MSNNEGISFSISERKKEERRKKPTILDGRLLDLVQFCLHMLRVIAQVHALGESLLYDRVLLELKDPI